MVIDLLTKKDCHTVLANLKSKGAIYRKFRHIMFILFPFFFRYRRE
ncbi:Uncharacterized protein BM_BM14291 [Brugia malayi]|uniref:Bm14291 n=1 Tax=Brugia malayi TaxID=6279 RepID=A0A0J9Y2W1_BRUMA|nr:Uncharacterized protein BM_BM14291 [Brugia malayi]CDQ00678.1 Bm14291 [Brugia malayi]VIO86435.1 Uncharacterized protein BM_BM14291 [Brugia malayi]